MRFERPPGRSRSLHDEDVAVFANSVGAPAQEPGRGRVVPAVDDVLQDEHVAVLRQRLEEISHLHLAAILESCDAQPRPGGLDRRRTFEQNGAKMGPAREHVDEERAAAAADVADSRRAPEVEGLGEGAGLGAGEGVDRRVVERRLPGPLRTVEALEEALPSMVFVAGAARANGLGES